MHGVTAKILHQWTLGKKGMKEQGYYAAAWQMWTWSLRPSPKAHSSFASIPD
jgi:hypothetical protein